ncbi:MAG: amidohydrolase family protein [Candidatus Auribacterota bacterium]|jgi:predicted TIM-barrel fold metal-dependent hydrolase|nr:amidohydrolase family protein [Candidatus Auribacterota bacterium]
MNIIDFHTHAFPDSIAARAIAALEAEGPCKAVTDGTINGLLRSMDKAGICTSVIASIATKPAQFEPILAWSKKIRSDRIIPFASIHPDDPDATEHIRITAQEGIQGIKLHPYYQQFVFNDTRMFTIYESIISQNLILLCHTGFDLAFPRDRICDPEKIMDVLERFPALNLVTSHLGAWEDWDEVERLMLGKPIYMEISYSKGFIPDNRIAEILNGHPIDYILFGTDSPWMDQSEAARFVDQLMLDTERKTALLYRNARRLLGMTP